MKKLLLFLMLHFVGVTYSQNSSCACVYQNSKGDVECFSGNCGNNNFLNCIINLNGSWYQGVSPPSGMTLCQYLIYIALPINLTSFTVETKNNYNLIQWSTASEINNDFFTIKHSIDGVNWVDIAYILGSGNSTSPQSYSHYHDNPPHKINYYKLSQTDYDGYTETFITISIDNRGDIYIEKIINVVGQEVGEDYEGVIINIYNNGSIKKVYNINNK